MVGNCEASVGIQISSANHDGWRRRMSSNAAGGALSLFQTLRALLAKLGPRSANAAFAGLLGTDRRAPLSRSASDSIRTLLWGLAVVVVFVAAASDPPAIRSSWPALTSSALLFLLGLEDFDALAAAADTAEVPTRLQKSA